MTKEEIRPIYNELQGYLSQAPETSQTFTFETSIGIQCNQAIDELNNLTSKDYNRYRTIIKPIEWNKEWRDRIEIQQYKTSLGGLIARLHGEYFPDEQPPFSGMPHTIINTTQNQSQSFTFEMVIEMTELITNKISQYEEGSKERTFFEKIKDGLKSGKGMVDLISLILSTGNALGLTLSEVLKLLSK